MVWSPALRPDDAKQEDPVVYGTKFGDKKQQDMGLDVGTRNGLLSVRAVHTHVPVQLPDSTPTYTFLEKSQTSGRGVPQ